MNRKKQLSPGKVAGSAFNLFTLGWIFSFLLENGLYGSWSAPASKYTAVFVTVIALAVVALLLFLDLPAEYARAVYLGLFVFYLVAALVNAPWLVIPDRYLFIPVAVMFLPEFIAFAVIIGNISLHGWDVYHSARKSSMPATTGTGPAKSRLVGSS